MPAQYPGNAISKAARAKAGGGFESAIEVAGSVGALSITQLDGNASHGSRIRVETDGTYNFGTKFQGPPVFWWFGDEMYINGVANNSLQALNDGDAFGSYEGIGSTSKVTRSRPTRHSNYSLLIRNPDDANSSIGVDYGALLASGRPNSIFTSWWARYPFNTQELALYELEGITGTPVLSTDGMDGDGEEFYIKGSGSTAPVGRFVGVTDGTDGQQVPALVGTFGKWLKFLRYSTTLSTRGETFVGITSGAELAMMPEVTAGSPAFVSDGPTKFSRVNTSPRADGVDQVRHIGSHRNTGSTVFVYDDVSGNIYNVTNNHTPTDSPYPWDENTPLPIWANTVVAMDASGQVDPNYLVDHCYYDFGKTPDIGGYRRAVFESTLVDQENGFIPLTRIDTTQMMIPQVLGLSLGYGHKYNHEFSEMVIDYEPHRVVIADSDTWANVTRTEIQRTISWSQTSVEVAINRGAVGSGWLYVLNSVDQPVNSSGVAL